MHFFFAKNPIQISRRAKRGGQSALAKSFLAVYFRNSSNGILSSPRGARLGCGGAKCAASPRTLTISSFSLAEYKFEHAKHAQHQES